MLGIDIIQTDPESWTVFPSNPATTNGGVEQVPDSFGLWSLGSNQLLRFPVVLCGKQSASALKPS